eukprot:scaffold46131_cov47-Prasinocladus_malaysianus.AAC.1
MATAASPASSSSASTTVPKLPRPNSCTIPYRPMSKASHPKTSDELEASLVALLLEASWTTWIFPQTARACDRYLAASETLRLRLESLASAPARLLSRACDPTAAGVKLETKEDIMLSDLWMEGAEMFSVLGS